MVPPFHNHVTGYAFSVCSKSSSGMTHTARR